jgi:hypothetical protein
MEGLWGKFLFLMLLWLDLLLRVWCPILEEQQLTGEPMQALSECCSLPSLVAEECFEAWVCS